MNMMGKNSYSFEQIKQKCRDVPDDFISMHLNRLDESYFSYYSSPDTVCEHLLNLWKITADSPFVFLPEYDSYGKISCTIISFDYPAIFSLITGILSGMGVRIESGVVFTYSDYSGTNPAGKHHAGSRLKAEIGNLYRKKIIDRFEGYLDTNLPRSLWHEETNRILKEIFLLMESGQEESSLRAKKLVNELVVKKLREPQVKEHDFLYPIDIQIKNDHETYTAMKVIAIDTPFFLYALSTALSIKGILIEYVNIKTASLQIEDEFHIVDINSKKISDQKKLDIIKFTVLLSKQFTYFLGSSPDPYTALSRFEYLVEEIVKLPEQGRWIEMLSNPDLMKNLARILVTSDQLWEEFIRLQYETIIPMLKSDGKITSYSRVDESLAASLSNILEQCGSDEEYIRQLNQFKDREIFLLDLDHILNPDFNFRNFSEKLTVLAEAIINKAFEFAYSILQLQHGTPRSVAGLKVKHCIIGLGKLGGAALGYASDIELLFVFSDNGTTDGALSINNAEFFARIIQKVISIVKSKREGIFKIDIRLRPYGSKGPLASSLDSFCQYYGPGGDAYSYERLALVRLRAIGGDADFGAMVERLRDEFIYQSHNIDPEDIFKIRKKQYNEKTIRHRINAKFSPGALVDLEYTVQLLQIINGRRYPSLKTSRIHAALGELARHRVLDEKESASLVSAYEFLRKLINGLRILRGSAKDLFLPESWSIEYAHLARRMGYVSKEDLSPEQQLHLEFATHTAQIRLFVERHFGRDSLPGADISGIADLLLSDSIPLKEQNNILYGYGFKNPERALVNLLSLLSKSEDKIFFAMLAVLASDIMKQKPDPDMALNNWERFVSILGDPEHHYKLLLSQPMELDILLTIFSESQFLSDTLIRNPQFLDWVIVPVNLYKKLTKKELTDELLREASECRSHEEWLNKLRRIRRREFLRIGTRDIYLGMTVHEIVSDLSTCAEAFIQAVMEHAWTELSVKYGCSSDINRHFCIIALGKLGGGELNYSSDIDLIGVYSTDDPETAAAGPDGAISIFNSLMKHIRYDLATYTEEGYAYRVDLRLRPYGSSGALVESLATLKKYYSASSSLWEIQALLKARPVAGCYKLGQDLLKEVRLHVITKFKRSSIIHTIRNLREKAVEKTNTNGQNEFDVKNGEGGIRDIEFLVQGIQLVNAMELPEIIHGNTLVSLELLKTRNLIPDRVAENLTNDYMFLRRLEHFLQLFEDRQVHTLPKDEDQRIILAHRFTGNDGTITRFNEMIAACRKRVRDAYNKYLN
jgi:glutamate-ammonia-ligase adenylyltransferase